MIKPETLQIAKTQIDLEIAEQNRQLDSTIDGIKRVMASKGMLKSGNLIVAVEDECVRVVKRRAEIVSQILHKSIQAVAVEYEDGLAQQLKEFVEPYFPEHMNGLRSRVLIAAKEAGLPDGAINSKPDEVFNARRAMLTKIKSEIDLFVLSLKKDSEAKTPSRVQMTDYVHQTRIDELLAQASKRFDLRKLIQFCRELNAAHRSECPLSIIMLCRAIIDHVPPIFEMKSFNEVVNNYPGTKTFKEHMERLNGSSRKIADQHLHTQIRTSEVLPNFNQVNFSADLDVLLSEIVRILQAG